MRSFSSTPKTTIAIVAFLLLGSMLWPLFNGDFWVIDDHHLISISTQLNNLEGNSIEKFMHFYKQTETFNPDMGRWRPVYHALRILKIELFGANSSLYFALNATCFTLTFIALGLAVGRFFQWYIAATFMICIASLPFNPALWPRLGPAEIDAFFFFALFLLGASRLDQRWGFALSCMSAFMAMGCKENFILLAPPLLFLALFGLYKRYLKKVDLLWVFIPITISAPLAWFLMKVIFTSGKDIYEKTTSAHSLTSLVPQFFSTGSFYIAVACTLLFAIFAIFMNRRGYKSIRKGTLQIISLHRDESVAIALSLASLLLLSLGNYLFYRGAPPSHSHYGMPYDLFPFLFALCALFPFRTLFADIYKNYKHICMPVLLGCILAGGHSQILENRASIEKHIAMTTDFMNKLQESKSYQRIYLINTESTLRLYEPYVSVMAYSAALELPPVSLFPFFPEPKTPLDNKIQKHLKLNAENLNDFYFCQSVILFETGLTFRTIEHAADKRAMSDLLFSYPQGSPQILDKHVGFKYTTTFHIITDNPNIHGFKIGVATPEKLSDWQISINGVIIDVPHLDKANSELCLPYTDEMRAKAFHPQFPSITFARMSPVPNYLMTLEYIEILRTPTD